MSMDDLYNNLKVYETKVKGMSISSSSTQIMAFVSSSNNNTSNNNEAVNTAHRVSTASTQVNAANFTNIDNFARMLVICTFFASQPNRSSTRTGGLYNKSIQMILEELEMDLKMGKMANVSFSNSKYNKRTRKLRVECACRNNIILTAVVSCVTSGFCFSTILLGLGESCPWSDHARKGTKTHLHSCLLSSSHVLPEISMYSIFPPPYTGNFMPPTPNLSFTGLDEFVNEPVVENCKAMSSEEESKVVRKYDDAPSIQEWVLDDEEKDVFQPKTKKKIVRPSIIKKEFVKFKQQEKIARKTVKQDQGVIDSGCSRHMTGNMSYLTDYEEIDGGYVAFGGNPKGGKITGKGTIKTGNLDFENVYFVRELKFNLFSVSQMCDKKNSVLFNDTECIVLSPNFKLIDESQVLLRVPRKNNMYSVDLKNIVPKGGLTCLFAKATSDESKLWHRRLGHLNFKTMNKLVKGNLVRGLPSKLFENDQTCVACQKGKQHRASCKSKTENSISLPLHLLHMDLFGPTFVKSLMKKMYCLVVTDDYSRRSKVTVIRCDNGTEFKNREMNQFCEMKGILRQFSIARTPQQNGVAKRRNRIDLRCTQSNVLQVQKQVLMQDQELKGEKLSTITFCTIMAADHRFPRSKAFHDDGST
ncbi:putative ribonuclease H-like domain-containing protein [Tanacetum coccineum]